METKKYFPDSKIAVKIQRILNMKFNALNAKRFREESEIDFYF